LKIYDSYVGEYSLGPASFTVSRDGDKLMFTAPGQPKIEAFPESETKFFFKIIDAQVTFLKDDKGTVTGLTFEINGRTLRATKVNRTASATPNK
jgi:hypothetical protein